MRYIVALKHSIGRRTRLIPSNSMKYGCSGSRYPSIAVPQSYILELGGKVHSWKYTVYGCSGSRYPGNAVPRYRGSVYSKLYDICGSDMLWAMLQTSGRIFEEKHVRNLFYMLNAKEKGEKG